MIKEFIAKLPKINESSNNNEDYYLAVIDAQIVNYDMTIEKQDILIQGDTIIGINCIDSASLASLPVMIIDATDKYLTPTLIDQHTHGGYDCDFNTATSDEIVDFLCKMPRHGIGALLPTIMTDSIENTQRQIAAVKEAKKKLTPNSAKILGIHLEGPYLSPLHKGIQPEDYIAKPSIANYKQVEDSEIKVVSYAPEFDSDFELTQYLSKHNVVASAAHTSASATDIEDASKQGLKQTTHTFNAMTPLHHRNPGVVGEALSNDNLYTEIIADCRHVHPKVLKILFRAKPLDKVIIVSDSLPLSKSANNEYVFGGHKIYKDSEMAVNAEGTMAGSLMFLNDICLKLLKLNLIEFSQFIKYTTYNVSENLGLSDIGFVKQGYKADFVLWNKDYKVEKTIINGNIACS